ncbi:MAG: hypothetical protein R3309_17165, partial [Reinekea sp.]|nr:hypothetical protein [Reinekea sp.]
MRILFTSNIKITKLTSLVALFFAFWHYNLEASGQNYQSLPKLSQEELQQIGNLIYLNECGGKTENLIVWNEGEEFPSLGIGHFIWYPAGKEGPFQETFPSLLEFYRLNGNDPPDWIGRLLNQDPPW